MPFIVSDEFERNGLGTERLQRLIQVGRDEKAARITADILPDNRGMQRVCEKLGFRLHFETGRRVIKAVIDL